MSKLINHVPIIDQFFGDLCAGKIDGVRPQVARSADVHCLYKEWATRSGLPTCSLPWLCRYLCNRYGIFLRQKHYAAGGFIVGPHSLMYLAGDVRTRPGLGQEVLGRQILEFRQQVDHYVERVGPDMRQKAKASSGQETGRNHHE